MKKWVWGLLWLSPVFAHGQSLPQVQAVVDAWKRDPELSAASWSLTVMDAQTGEVLLSQDPNRVLATASTMKVITTATAMALLGPEYRFETRIEYDGVLRDGVLTGNIYLRGGGDPSLGSERFGEEYALAEVMHVWAMAIRNAGIREIRGQVIGDDRIYSTQMLPGNWVWDDIGNYYGAGACGLNINENLYRLDLRPGVRAGLPVTILRTDPPMRDITFVNELSTGSPGTGDNAYIFGSPYTYLRYLRGTIPAGHSSFTIKGSMPDPALYCAQRLTEELRLCSTPVSGEAGTMRIEQLAGTSQGMRKILYVHSSPPLSDIVYFTNLKSVNIFAEALALRVAIARDKEGNPEAAGEAIREYWRAQGVDVNGMKIRDGSGLSPNNAVSSKQLASILYRVRQSAYYESFRASLPVAGKSGTLQNMLKGTAAEGRIFAKSGFISGARAYAGYADTPDGRQLIFTVIANNYSCSNREMGDKLERMMLAIAMGR